MRERVRQLVEGERFQTAIIALIVFNAILLGLESIPIVRRAVPINFSLIDHIILWIFVVEILLRFFAHRFAMARDPWSIFDVWVVGISMFAMGSGLSAFRALRVLRILRLISAFPKMRRVVVALLDSIPGIASVGFLLLLIVYVAAVLATNMFGPAFPDLFGDLFVTMYTLFQILTLEGWVDIAREVMAVYPYAWVFFVVFILVATFTLLNLFVAIVVSVLDDDIQADHAELVEQNKQLREDVRGLAGEVRRLAGLLENRGR